MRYSSLDAVACSSSREPTCLRSSLRLAISRDFSSLDIVDAGVGVCGLEGGESHPSSTETSLGIDVACLNVLAAGAGETGSVDVIGAFFRSGSGECIGAVERLGCGIEGAVSNAPGEGARSIKVPLCHDTHSSHPRQH